MQVLVRAQFWRLFLAPVSHGSATHLAISLAVLLRAAGFEAAHGAAAAAQVLLLLAVRSYRAPPTPLQTSHPALCPRAQLGTEVITLWLEGAAQSRLGQAGSVTAPLSPIPYFLPMYPNYPWCPLSQPPRPRAGLHAPRAVPHRGGPVASVVAHGWGWRERVWSARALQHCIRCCDRDLAHRGASGGTAVAACGRARTRRVPWNVGDSSPHPLLGGRSGRRLHTGGVLTAQEIPACAARHVRAEFGVGGHSPHVPDPRSNPPFPHV